MKTALAYAFVMGALISGVSFAGEGGGTAQHFAVFAGQTKTDHETSPSYGFDYVYPITESLGAALIVDRTLGHHPFTIVGLGLSHSYSNGLKTVIAAGAEMADGHSLALGRVSFGYDYHIGSLSVGPLISYDRISGGHAAVVYGLSMGISF